MEAGFRKTQLRKPAFSLVQTVLTRLNTSSRAELLLEIVLPVLPLFLTYLLQPGVPAAIDAALHLRQANDYALVLFSTHGMPDWDPFVFNGFGAPAFRFAGQLPLLLASMLGLAGLTPGAALKFTVLAYALAGSWGMREFLRGEDQAWPRRLVGSLCLFSGPAVAMHLFHNFFFQHLCGVLIFPWLLAGMKGSARRLAVAIGIICWTHMQMAFVCLALAGLAALVGAVSARSMRILGRFCFAAAVGVCLAGPFWLPAVLTVRDIHVEGKRKVRPGIESHFVDDVFRLGNEPGLGESARNTKSGTNAKNEIGRLEGLVPAVECILNRDETIHSEYGWVMFRYLRSWILLATVIVLALSLLGIMLAPRPGTAGIALAGFLSGLAMFRFSMPVWQNVPRFAELIEFPWRLLIPMQVLLTPLMTDGGFAAARLAGGKARGAAIPLVFLAAFSALPAISGVFVAVSRPMPQSDIDYYINEAQAVAPVFKPVHAPLQTNGRPDSAALFPVTIIRGSGKVVEEEPGLAGREFRAEIATGGATVRIGAHYDAAWRLAGEGTEHRLSPAAADGAMTAELPAGTHALALERRMPSGRGQGIVLLLIGAVALLLL